MSNVTEKIVMAPEYESFRKFVETLDESSFKPEEKIFQLRNRIYRHEENGKVLAIKCFSKPNAINRVAYTYFRPGKARRSFDNSLKLQQAGISVPRPIAYREIYRNGMLAESFYISEFIDGVNEVREWEKSADRKKIMQGVAEMMANLHKANIYFRDFSPGNILYDKDWNFYLVDVNRMEFNCNNPQIMMRNFRAIHHDINEVIRLAEIYCGVTPYADADPRDIIRAARDQKIDYINEKKWHRFFKRLIGK